MTSDDLEIRLREFARADHPPTLDVVALAQSVVFKRRRSRRVRQISRLAVVAVLISAVWIFTKNGVDDPNANEQARHGSFIPDTGLTGSETNAEASHVLAVIEKVEWERTLAEYDRRLEELGRTLARTRQEHLRDQLALHRIKASHQVQLALTVPSNGTADPKPPF